jgi:hypothetical protein
MVFAPFSGAGAQKRLNRKKKREKMRISNKHRKIFMWGTASPVNKER